MRDLDDLFGSLGRSNFRRSFHLGAKERAYVTDKGMPKVIEHARNFVATRLAPASPVNDGKQTPFKGHPVFIAQHATATCCRSCLAKWHRIEAGSQLSAEEQGHAVAAIERWINQEMSNKA
jgi:hypothetical protein